MEKYKDLTVFSKHEVRYLNPPSNPVTYTIEVPGFERIVYEDGPKGEPKECVHEGVIPKIHSKTRHLVSSSGSLIQTEDGWVPNSVLFNYPAYPLGFFGRAYDDLVPKIDNDSNMVNFILELSDFKRMFTSIAQSILLLTKGKVLLSAAQAALTYGFGVQPFIADVKNFANSYASFKQKYDKLISNQGNVRVHHYAEEFEVAGHENINDLGVIKLTQSFATGKARAGLTVRYRYTLASGNLPSTLSQYMRSIGFRLSAKTVWDAIPYSFLVDWAAGIGDWLDRFDSNPIPISIEILSAQQSLRYRQVCDGGVKSGSPDSNPRWTDDYKSLIRWSYKFYERRDLDPYALINAISTPRFQRVTIRKLVLGASLLIAKSS